MAIKRIIGKQNVKYKTCLRCGRRIEAVLKDDEVYTCEHCGQQHFVDVYKNRIVLTVAEYADLRRRPPEKARAALIAKVEKKRQEEKAWVEKHKAWLEELAAMPEQDREIEFSLMGLDMLKLVKAYLENRSKE